MTAACRFCGSTLPPDQTCAWCKALRRDWPNPDRPGKHCCDRCRAYSATATYRGKKGQAK